MHKLPTPPSGVGRGYVFVSAIFTQADIINVLMYT